VETKAVSFIITLHLLVLTSVFSQDLKPITDKSKIVGNGVKSSQINSVCLGDETAPSLDLNWKPLLVKIKELKEFHPEVPDEEKLDSIKKAKQLIKQESFRPNAENDYQKTTPILGANWLGNLNSGSSPLDNNIAISNGGIIVSVSNDILEIDDSQGSLLYYNDFATFFNSSSIEDVCDPVVLYDNQADRFILFFQECSGTSANSKLCIAFSKTNNPSVGGWWKYLLTGNPLDDGSWFDYPKMSISSNELYITGNLFYETGGFNEAILYQIDKSDGYNGAVLTWQYWHNISGSPFTLLPVGHGQGLNFGPGCYLVATESSGSSSIDLYDLTDYMSGNPSLNRYVIPTTTYSPAANANQLGSSCMLDNGDCRTLSGFYLDGTIHFVFHSDIGNGWNGINYNRLSVSNGSNTSAMIGIEGSYDYSYPAIASIGNGITDKSVIIGFLRSGSDIYPQVRAINCDNTMAWSSSILVKGGDDFASYTSATTERWGDYTGACRKYNSGNVWINGMYGNFENKWDTWIAEISIGQNGLEETASSSSKIKVSPNPIYNNYSIEFNLEQSKEIEIQLVDQNGNIIKSLYSGYAHSGTNKFSFNKGMLPSGMYFLEILDKSKNKIQNEKIIISSSN
jgi:hypothetical protein